MYVLKSCCNSNVSTQVANAWPVARLKIQLHLRQTVTTRWRPGLLAMLQSAHKNTPPCLVSTIVLVLQPQIIHCTAILPVSRYGCISFDVNPSQVRKRQDSTATGSAFEFKVATYNSSDDGGSHVAINETISGSNCVPFQIALCRLSSMSLIVVAKYAAWFAYCLTVSFAFVDISI